MKKPRSRTPVQRAKRPTLSQILAAVELLGVRMGKTEGTVQEVLESLADGKKRFDLHGSRLDAVEVKAQAMESTFIGLTRAVQLLPGKQETLINEQTRVLSTQISDLVGEIRAGNKGLDRRVSILEEDRYQRVVGSNGAAVVAVVDALARDVEP